ncbi:hypothetical protein [Erwinia phyllosphaerae]|uniref:hypothetical protein n=1 Tax=Erwinia phyllosphaerae TaxID=2853256 RepID=UPI001FEF7263|nr:hypothetical protein [Erwinia phyllosphaerae]MBV4366250.1 hypothetical protein [Erwinia phyllosphaerae]
MTDKSQTTWPEKVEALEAQVNELTALIKALAAENLAKSKCLAFFASVIKAGELWTITCQQEYDHAQRFRPVEKGGE